MLSSPPITIFLSNGSSLSTPPTPHCLHLSLLPLYTTHSSPLTLYTPHSLHLSPPPSLHLSPPSSLLPLPYSGILNMVGEAELEMASQIAQYEIMLSNDVISPLTAMLEVNNSL